MAVAQHQRGQLVEAEALYSKILAINPRHAESLHYAGVAALQQGRHQEAADLIEKSLALRDRNAEAHYHLGLAMAGLRRFEETAAQNRNVIALKPDHLEAHLNLGNALKELGRLDEAAACYERAIALNPKAVFAHYNLANVLMDKREFEAAIRSFERALAVQPNFPQALQNFGTALLLQGRIDDAIAKFDAALAAWPQFVEALVGRALALLTKGNAYDAFGDLCRALDIRPIDEAKPMFVDCIRALERIPLAAGLEKHMIAAIAEPWSRPRELGAVVDLLLRARGAVADIIAQSAAGGADFALAQSHLEALAADRLLLAVLENVPVVSLQVELILTAARRKLLAMAHENPASISEALLGFACALARQCFINEYIFDLADDERARAREQRDRLAAALDAAAAPTPLLLAVTAAYGPLYEIAGGERLLARSWPAPVDAVLQQQLREPREERELRGSIPSLTPIDDDVSSKVQRQYEENPYPRWIKIPPQPKAISFDDTIRKMLPRAPFQPTGKGVCDILVAGCGTGQEPLDLAQYVAGARILAVDLSQSSLAHAKRKTIELGVKNIDYAQGDILKLPALGRTFDFVTAGGVLHHMADPFAAWRGLLTLVRPGGLMRLGLYSEAARQNVLAAREFIAAHGFQANADDIRRARRAIASLPDGSLAKKVTGSDFFSTSECRDLLFHAQEHRLTIPQIKKFIDENGVRFLGFMVGHHVTGKYMTRFSQDPSLTDLDNWHAFETDHPDTFAAMYQFVVQLPPTAANDVAPLR